MSLTGFIAYFVTRAAVVAVLALPAAATVYLVWHCMGRPPYGPDDQP